MRLHSRLTARLQSNLFALWVRDRNLRGHPVEVLKYAAFRAAKRLHWSLL